MALDGLFWAAWVLLAVFYETWALHEKHDRWQPLTHWVRWLIYGPRPSGYSWFRPAYWLAVGAFIWTGIHFFVDPLLRHRL